MTQDELKQAVARDAIRHVVDDAWIGVGTGSTANFFIDELAKIKDRIKGAVASSVKTAERLKSHGIPVEELNNTGDLAVYIDGADEVTEHGAMIKGGGGALTREKIVAAASRKFVCIVDGSKLVDVLGTLPAADRGDPDGAQLRRARDRAPGRTARAAAGLHHRQRQRHPRRAQPEDPRPGEARDRAEPDRRCRHRGPVRAPRRRHHPRRRRRAACGGSTCGGSPAPAAPPRRRARSRREVARRRATISE